MDIAEELARLRHENQLLREQNAALQGQNAALQGQNAALQGQNAALQGQNAALQGQVELLAQRIEELEGGGSSAPFFVKASKAKPTGPRGPRRKRASGCNRGRQRALEVTRREAHRLERCPDCGGKLRGERLAWRREVVELPPPPRVEVIQHEVYEGQCQRCGGWKHPRLAEEGVTFGKRRFGPRLCALMGYLRSVLGMPERAIQSYLATLHGVEVSLGAIADVLRGIAVQGQGAVEALREEMRGSEIVHADETGWREDGQNGYVWVFSTPGAQGVRYFVYDPHRSQEVVARELGETFQGVLVSDFYGAYNVYRGRHQRCWAHLLRDLHELKQEHGDQAEVLAWAGELRGLYERAQALGQSAHQEERQRGYGELLEAVERLALPYARAKHPCRALAKRLLRHRDELFQFVLVAGLAADNNLAERSLRPLVVLRKISGGSRSGQGSQTRMTLASLFGTWRLRSLDPFMQCLQLISPNSSG